MLQFSKLYATAVGADASSTGKVPVLVDGPLVLAESAVVAEYLVNKFGPDNAKDTALSPTALSPEQRARAQIFAEQVIPAVSVVSMWAEGFREHLACRSCCVQVYGGFYTLLRARGEEAQAAAATSLLGSLERLAAELAKDSSGPYFAGARLSLADVLIWPWIARIGILKHYRGFAVPQEPRFEAYHDFVSAMQARPAVRATQAEDSFYIDGYRSYAE